LECYTSPKYNHQIIENQQTTILKISCLLTEQKDFLYFNAFYKDVYTNPRFSNKEFPKPYTRVDYGLNKNILMDYLKFNQTIELITRNQILKNNLSVEEKEYMWELAQLFVSYNKEQFFQEMEKQTFDVFLFSQIKNKKNSEPKRRSYVCFRKNLT